MGKKQIRERNGNHARGIELRKKEAKEIQEIGEERNKRKKLGTRARNRIRGKEPKK